jgi:hypothetical protein
MNWKFLPFVAGISLGIALGIGGLESGPWAKVAALKSGTLSHSAPLSCDQETLMGMKNEYRPNVPCMQAHAWEIVTTKLVRSGEPLWYDWCAMTTENGRTLNCPAAKGVETRNLAARDTAEMVRQKGVKQFLGSFEDLRQISLLPAAATSNPQSSRIGITAPNGIAQDAALASARSRLFETSQVLFNSPSQGVISNCFSDQVPVTSLGSKKIHLSDPRSALHPCTEDEIKTQMSDDMIAIKPVWAITEESNVANVSYPIPVWVDRSPHGPPSTALEGKAGALATPSFTRWQTQVSVVLPPHGTSSGEACDLKKDFIPSEYPNEPKVPLSCFYSLTITIQQWNTILESLNLSPHPVAVNADKDTIYIILMGFHVITKEIPDWTWQTFWWNWKAGSDPESPFQGSQSLDPRWSHYQSSVTYGAPDPRPIRYTNREVFNPYLESRLPNGVHSNCLACHTYATYHTDHPLDRFLEGEFLGTGVCKEDILPTPISTGCDADNFLSSGFQTHFLWSLADTNVHPEGANLPDLLDRVKELDRFLTSLEADRDTKLNTAKKKANQKR